MNLVIDIGNTFIKAGIFNNSRLEEVHHRLNEDSLASIVKNTIFDHVLISSVRANIDGIKNLFSDSSSMLVMSSTVALPIQNLYKSPATLGMDRIAAAVGAFSVYPNEDCLVLDAGTCLTYEFISKNNQYLGGAISPGMEMRFKALNTFTQKLPLISRIENPPLTGGNTEESILSGVILGIVAEVEGIIGRYRTNYPDIKVILCGGDAPFFESKIKGTIFAIPDLVLIGLNSILIHNVSES